jgi:hypothetical protein
VSLVSSADFSHTHGVPHSFASVFVELVRTPFQHVELVWGVVPLYFGWAVNELTSARATFNTALQTGFALLWAGAQWTWQMFREHPDRTTLTDGRNLLSVSSLVTLLVLLAGAVALWSGLRRRYPRGFKFLGHTRFSGYFMIAIFPIQSGHLAWSWDRVAAIALFAVPIWLVMHFALMPVRR